MSLSSQPEGRESSLGELKPCPFCGGEVEVNQIGNEFTRSRGFEVKCLTWGCATKKRAMVIRQPLEKAREYAITAWNRRPTYPETVGVREALLSSVLAEELLWIAVFAEMRAADDSKVFAKVARGALRSIGVRAREAIAQAEEAARG